MKDKSVSMETVRTAMATVEVRMAHERLDTARVPRVIQGRTASLAQRIAYLEGKLRSAELFNQVVQRRARR